MPQIKVSFEINNERLDDALSVLIFLGVTEIDTELVDEETGETNHAASFAYQSG